MLAMREELDRRSSEHHGTVAQMEAANLDLLRKQEAAERQLVEWKQDHLSETVALRGRLEETVGDHHSHQVGLGDVKQEVNDERTKRREEMAAVRCRLETLERNTQAAQGRGGGGGGGGGESGAELSELRASLLQANQDLVRLAQDFTNMREEHDQAISSLGSLTELVAKTATAGIQRSEERMAADLTGKRRDFERAVAKEREQMEKDMKAIIMEVKSLSPSLMALGGAKGEPDGPMEAGLRRVDALARELRSEAEASEKSSAQRMAAVEVNVGNDMKRLRSMMSNFVGQLETMQVELSQLALARLEPRVKALEDKGGTKGGHDVDSESTTDTGKTRSMTDPDVSSASNWLSTLSKVVSGLSPGNTSTPRKEQLRQGLKDKLNVIASSVHQVLGALDGEDAESALSDSQSPGLSLFLCDPQALWRSSLRSSWKSRDRHPAWRRSRRVRDGREQLLSMDEKRSPWRGG
ncbi:unnamed protein product [Effrenium voratum]|nr:unnamed protein product [Effrenium voratum]